MIRLFFTFALTLSACTSQAEAAPNLSEMRSRLAQQTHAATCLLHHDRCNSTGAH